MYKSSYCEGTLEKMDEGSSHKRSKVGAAKGGLSEATPGILEKKIDDLGARIERLTEQIKALQVPQTEQKLVVGAASAAEPEKKQEGVQQAKAQDVIYVKKSTEFSFYS
jgi:hypothetical protein